MSILGCGLGEARHHEEALSVREADLATMRRLGADEDDLLATQINIANSYTKMGRLEEAISISREVYAGFKSLVGPCDRRTLMAANNLVFQLQKQSKFAEAVSILRKPLSDARRAFGDDHEQTLALGSLLADSLAGPGTSPTVDDLREAIAIREDICKRSRRLLGRSHPNTQIRQRALDSARSYLARHFPEG